MIVLKKGNHYEHTMDGSKASKMIADGYELVKGKGLLSPAKKELKTKKEPKSKSKK